MSKVDFVIVNAGDRQKIYQGLGTSITAIEQPTFALLIATYVRKMGYSVKVIDVPAHSYSPSDVASMIREADPALVGMFSYGYQPNASTQNMGPAIELSKTIKELAGDNVPICITGTHASALPKETLLENSCFDYVCDREGFDTFVVLIQHLNFGHPPIDEVPDLWYRNDKKEVVFTKRGKLLTPKQLDEMVDAPAWDLVDMSVYRCHNWQAFGNPTIRQPYASLYTSLGCPYKCHFCCINAPFGNMTDGSPRPYRLWSPETIIKQIDILYNQYGVRIFKFVDEMFVLNRKHVEGICDLIIERGYTDINIWAYARVDTVIDDLLDKMRKAGFRWLCLGIESGSEFVRDGANKSFEDSDIVRVVRKIQEHDIYVLGNYLFGLPDDTIESMQHTLDLALYLKTEWANFYSAMAYPGSPLYKYAVEHNWKLPPSWTGFSQHSYDTCPLPTNHISNVDVLRFRDNAHIQYFSNPEYQEYVKSVFGQETVDSINEMLKYKMKRQILGD